MQLDKFLIGMVVFSVVILTGVLLIIDADNNYQEFNLTSSENDSFASIRANAEEILNSTEETTGNQKDALTGEEIESDEAWESMIKGGYSAIKLTTGSFDLTLDTLDTVQQELGFPSYFKDAAFAVIVILVIFALIYLVFRFKG